MKMPGPKGPITVKGNQELARRLVHRQERDNVNIISADRPPANIMHILSNVDTPKEENSNIFTPKPRPKGEFINIHLFEEQDPHVVKNGSEYPPKDSEKHHPTFSIKCQNSMGYNPTPARAVKSNYPPARQKFQKLSKERDEAIRAEMYEGSSKRFCI
jgi:hypothetical protein